MATLADFLERLFDDGRVAFDAPPVPAEADGDRAAAAEVLRRAFIDDLMELAGPPLPFDEATALAAADWTRRACWFLVSRAEPPEVVDRALAAPPAPRSAAEHLAADQTFRYLPAVHRRARAIDPGDVLARRLAEVLRSWPLSGVRSDVPDAPTSPLDFDGHRGLMLRFAERWAERESPAWLPPEGPGRDAIDLVRDAIGRRSAAVGTLGTDAPRRSAIGGPAGDRG